jgi:hypothetical protein
MPIFEEETGAARVRVAIPPSRSGCTSRCQPRSARRNLEWGLGNGIWASQCLASRGLSGNASPTRRTSNAVTRSYSCLVTREAAHAHRSSCRVERHEARRTSSTTVTSELSISRTSSTGHLFLVRRVAGAGESLSAPHRDPPSCHRSCLSLAGCRSVSGRPRSRPALAHSSRPGRTEQALDTIRCFVWPLVLPDPQHVPASRGQRVVTSPVSRLVGFELLTPPVPICRRCGSMPRARVPKAPVDVDGHLGSGEDDVGGAANIR